MEPHDQGNALVAGSLQTPSLFRSKLGNALLAANLAYIVRGLLLGLAATHQPCFSDLHYYSPNELQFDGSPLLFNLYNIAHAPTWSAIELLEWLFRPAFYLVSYETILAVQNGAFVAISSLQWLICGYAIERIATATSLDVYAPVSLSIAPNKRVQRSARSGD